MADDMLHGMDEFLGEIAVGDQDHADHVVNALRKPCVSAWDFFCFTNGALLPGDRPPASPGCGAAMWGKIPMRARPQRSVLRRTPSGASRRYSRRRCGRKPCPAPGSAG